MTKIVCARRRTEAVLKKKKKNLQDLVKKKKNYLKSYSCKLPRTYLVSLTRSNKNTYVGRKDQLAKIFPQVRGMFFNCRRKCPVSFTCVV